MIFKNEKLQNLVVYWYKKALELKEEKNKMAEKIKLLEDRNELMVKQLKEQTALTNEYKEALKLAQVVIANKDNMINELTPKMTYEQIIDIKCENARLREENAKFAKWKRILDKFKIF